jgi:branched-chain amino acid transport system ATP-binding protein
MTALSCHEIEVRYGAVEAVRGISFGVGEGESIALLGANGAGKTSLVMAAMGVSRDWRGTVRLLEQDISRWSASRRVKAGLALVPEGRRITGSLSVDDNLDLGGYWRPGKSLEQQRREIWEMFPRLHERRSQLAGTLSGGEQQMLAIARALMGKPRVILMDEPTMGLAPSIVDTVLESIVTIQRESGISVVVVEQNARAALEVCTRGYLIKEGRVVRAGSARELRHDEQLADVYLR